MSDYDENEDAFDEAKINEEIASPDKKVRADAIERLAQKTFFDGNPEKSLIYLGSVADLRTELEDHSGLMWTYNQMGYVESERSHFNEALDYYKQMIEQARKAMNTKGEIDGLSLCGAMCRRMKRYEEAADYLLQAVEVAMESDYRFLPHLKADLARMFRKIGRLDDAEKLLTEAQEAFLQNGFDNNVPRAENELASTLFDESNIELSLTKATEAYNLAKYDENTREVDRAQFLMARCLNKLGRFAEALKILEEMKARSTNRKRQKHRARTDLEFARALVGLERRRDATSLLNVLIPVLKAHKLHFEACDAIRMQGHNLLVMGELLEAEQLLVEASTLAEEHDFDDYYVEANTLLAICYEVMERHADKVHQYELIAANPLNMGRIEFWMAAGEIALHYARLGDVEVANRYVNAIKSAPSEQLTKHFKAQSQEARAVMLMAEGNKVKAKNLANKAMANYLLDDRIEDAQRCASMVAED